MQFGEILLAAVTGGGLVCDDAADCVEIDLEAFGGHGAPGTRWCCRDESTECDSGLEGQCCPGLLCDSETDTCEQCEGIGEMKVTGCCPPLVTHPGSICGADCLTHPLVGMTCDENPCNGSYKSEWVCTVRGLECPPTGGPTGTDDDDCDGNDDDCDGDVDEHYDPGTTANCMEEVVECDETFDGVKHCVDGAEVCMPRPGIDYCVYDSSVFGTHLSADCGAGPGSLCTMHSQCAPNAACTAVVPCVMYPGTCVVCERLDCGYPVCWAPMTTGTGMCP